MPIMVFALLACAGVLASLVLPKVFPRAFIALFALIELPLCGWPQIGALRRIALILAVAGGRVSSSSRRKSSEALMRAVCAMAALLAAGLLPEAHHFFWVLGAFAVLFVSEELVRRLAWSEYDYLSERQFEYERDRTEAIEQLARVGAVLGAVVALAIICLPMFAQPLALPILSDRPELPPLPVLRAPAKRSPREAIARVA